MSYLVLARKWRPQNFQDVVGQQSIVQTLQNALKRERVAHAMIFSGVRGVGKTTLARIMAKALNCHSTDTPPCDQCSSCKEIVSGISIDLHEIDGASNRGINEIRELKENIRFQPAQEKYKIIIIDEVHMLTTEAFNALLKTLEEPPEHVFFMFATTELHKVPITILSRCQRYELKRVSQEDLTSFFEKITQKEGVEISNTSLQTIAREADGSVRDGLSLLDQVFSFGGDKISDEDIGQVLGLVDNRIFAKIAAAMLASDLTTSLELLNSSYSQGMDLKRFALGLLTFFRALLICKNCQEPSSILDLSAHEIKTAKEMSSPHSTETLSAFFNLLLQTIDDMQHTSQARMTLEMSFIKAAQFGNIVPITQILGKLDSYIEQQPAEPPKNDPAPAVQQAPQPTPPVQELPKPAIKEELKPAQAAPTPISDAPKAAIPAATPVDKKKTEPPPVVAPPPPKDINREWDQFIIYVKDRKKWMGSALAIAEKTTEKEGELIISYDDPSECAYLQETENINLLSEFAQDFFQKELTIKITTRGGQKGSSSQDTPQEERRALTNDPRVQVTLEVLGAQVSGIRTGPRSR